MKIEVLIATMFQDDTNFLSNIGLKSSGIVINQTYNSCVSNYRLSDEIDVFMINSLDRGLSKSRNQAIANAKGDLCLIADDDITYFENYTEIIQEAYLQLKDADIIIFDYVTDSNSRGCTPIAKKVKKLGFLDLLKVSSVRITFKRKSIVDKGIKFDELFGAGAIFSSGEENLFLKKSFEKGLNIFYVPKPICKVDFSDSTWFSNYNESYFETKGAFGLAMFGNFYLLYIIQFLIRKYRLYKRDISSIKAFKACINGKNKYLKISKCITN